MNNPTNEAAEYLHKHKYEGILPRGPTEVSHESMTGDGTWESGVAEERRWMPKDKGPCCYSWEKTQRDFKYCPNDGVGINNVITWVRNKKDDELDATLRELEKSLKTGS